MMRPLTESESRAVAPLFEERQKLVQRIADLEAGIGAATWAIAGIDPRMDVEASLSLVRGRLYLNVEPKPDRADGAGDATLKPIADDGAGTDGGDVNDPRNDGGTE